MSGLSQIENEVGVLRRMPDPPPSDRFVATMEVRLLRFRIFDLICMADTVVSSLSAGVCE